MIIKIIKNFFKFSLILAMIALLFTCLLNIKIKQEETKSLNLTPQEKFFKINVNRETISTIIKIEYLKIMQDDLKSQFKYGLTYDKIMKGKNFNDSDFVENFFSKDTYYKDYFYCDKQAEKSCKEMYIQQRNKLINFLNVYTMKCPSSISFEKCQERRLEDKVFQILNDEKLYFKDEIRKIEESLVEDISLYKINYIEKEIKKAEYELNEIKNDIEKNKKKWSKEKKSQINNLFGFLISVILVAYFSIIVMDTAKYRANFVALMFFLLFLFLIAIKNIFNSNSLELFDYKYFYILILFGLNYSEKNLLDLTFIKRIFRVLFLFFSFYILNFIIDEVSMRREFIPTIFDIKYLITQMTVEKEKVKIALTSTLTIEIIIAIFTKKKLPKLKKQIILAFILSSIIYTIIGIFHNVILLILFCGLMLLMLAIEISQIENSLNKKHLTLLSSFILVLIILNTGGWFAIHTMPIELLTLLIVVIVYIISKLIEIDL